MFIFNYVEKCLTFKNDFMELNFSPENPDCINENGFDSSPSNGEFNFYYKDDEIIFNCVKHGDKKGGSLSYKFKMTSEIKESLYQALLDWKNYIKTIKDFRERVKTQTKEIESRGTNIYDC